MAEKMLKENPDLSQNLSLVPSLQTRSRSFLVADLFVDTEDTILLPTHTGAIINLYLVHVTVLISIRILF